MDGAGGGLMGPYVPLVDYVDPNNQVYLPPSGAPIPALPAASSCGALSYNGTPIFPAVNNPSISGGGNGPLNWPQTYWPGWGTVANELVCGSQSSEPSNQIYYAATQRITEAVNKGCNSVPNTCTDAIPESPQESWDLATGQYLWQPPAPITIVGTGFGYLPSLPQTMASCATPQNCPNYLRIQNDGGSGVHLGWDTSMGAPCQVYIANWTDTSVSVMANLPVGVVNGLGTAVSPLTDIGPLTLPQSLLSGAPPLVCQVMPNDKLTLTVTNPQSGIPLTLPSITVQAYSASPN